MASNTCTRRRLSMVISKVYVRPIVAHSNIFIIAVLQSNIFVDDHYHALLADFGLVIVGEVTAGRMSTAQDFGGTLQWSAPERFNSLCEMLRPTTASDVYAFGCLCFMVCSPFHCSNK